MSCAMNLTTLPLRRSARLPSSSTLAFSRGRRRWWCTIATCALRTGGYSYYNHPLARQQQQQQKQRGQLVGNGVLQKAGFSSTSTRLAIPENEGEREKNNQPSTSTSSQTAGSAPSSSHQKKKKKYTTDTYPTLQRNPTFNTLTPEHIATFKQILDNDPAGIIDGVTTTTSSTTDLSDLDPFNTDWMRKYRGHSRLVLRPRTTSQISSILAYCNAHRLAIVPQGGNTGLVGGGVPVFDEIVLSLARLNRIRSFDANSGALVVDGGVILEVADGYVRERGHIFPLDLGAKGSCMVGGNVATNAGGLRLLRYGNLHGSVLGLEVVLADGRVVEDLGTLRKDNTGYDLKQMFIGSEGTIGVITGVAVQCAQKPQAVNVAYLAMESYEAALRTFVEAKAQLSEVLSAFELMDRRTQRMVRDVAELKPPLSGGGSDGEGDNDPISYPFYCLIETSGSNGEHDTAKLEGFLEHVLGEGMVADGVVAQDEKQVQTLWRWREGITEALSHLGGTYKYDVSIPLDELYQLVEDTRKRCIEAGIMMAGEESEKKKEKTTSYPVRDVVGYGHMGDGNLHLNISVGEYNKEVEKVIEPWVYEWIRERRGSISAEHGIGIAKREFLGYSKDETMVGLMRQLKSIYDPNGILNPYKYV